MRHGEGHTAVKGTSAVAAAAGPVPSPAVGRIGATPCTALQGDLWVRGERVAASPALPRTSSALCFSPQVRLTLISKVTDRASDSMEQGEVWPMGTFPWVQVPGPPPPSQVCL